MTYFFLSDESAMAVADEYLLYVHRSKPRLLQMPRQDETEDGDSNRTPQLAMTTSHGAPGVKSSRRKNEKAIWNKLNQKDHLCKELHDQFGDKARVVAFNNYLPRKEKMPSREPRLIDKLLGMRKEDRSSQAAIQASQLQQLKQEKEKLIQEKQRIQSQHRRLGWDYLPTFSSSRSVQSEPWPVEDRMRDFRSDSPRSMAAVESLIRHTDRTLTAQIARYNRLREEFDYEYERLYKPYQGEMGPQSYESWQMEDYHMVRGLVEEIIDQFLDANFRDLPPAVDPEISKAVMEVDTRALENTRKSLSESRVMRLLMEEIVLEGTRELASEAATQVLHLSGFLQNSSNEKMVEIVGKVTAEDDHGGSRDSSRNTDQMVSNTFYQLQKEREKRRKNIWCHTQQLQFTGNDEIYEDTPEGEDDVILLQFHDIVAMNRRTFIEKPGESYRERAGKKSLKNFETAEVRHWKLIDVNVRSVAIGAQFLGIYTARPSPNHRYLALGSVHGDVMVHDVTCQPMRLIRVIPNHGSGHDAVVDICWSLDSRLLATINQLGLVQVWSMQAGGTVGTDRKNMEVKPDGTGFVPEQLSQVLVLDTEAGDLGFQFGPLAEAKVLPDGVMPITAAFAPTLAFLGSQSKFCIGLDCGDILWCNMEGHLYGLPASEESENALHKIHHPPVKPHDSQLSYIGNGITAEMFRCHQHPLLFVGFVEHLSQMVSVDQEGYVFIWKYVGSMISTYGWFQPQVKYRLDMSKTVHVPVANSKPNAIFDEKYSTNGRRTKAEIARERQQVMAYISSLQLPEPLYRYHNPEQHSMTEVYPDQEPIPHSGGNFHILVRHTNSGQLSSYYMEFLQPAKVSSVRLLDCKPSPDNSYLVFVLLFPSYPPQEAHITVVLLDLKSMSLKDFVLHIPLDSEELYMACFQDSVVSCGVSRPLGVTSSAYLFLNINASLSVFSLTTGAQVLRMEDPKRPIKDGFPGCRISRRGLDLAPTSQLTVMGFDNKFYLVIHSGDQRYKKPLNQLAVVEMIDSNPEEGKSFMKAAARSMLSFMNLDHPSVDISVADTHWYLDQHPKAFAKQILMEVIDEVIQYKHGDYSEEQQVAFDQLDRERNYKELIPEIKKSAHSIHRGN